MEKQYLLKHCPTHACSSKSSVLKEQGTPPHLCGMQYLRLSCLPLPQNDEQTDQELQGASSPSTEN